MWIWILLLVIISIYNTVYSFLPERFQKKMWIKLCGGLAAIVILIYGLVGIVASYANESYAVIAPDGKVIRSKNFDWKIVIGTSQDDNYPLFIIDNRYGDASDIKVIPSDDVPFEKYLTYAGLGIKFFCERDAVPKFRIKVK